MTAAMYVPMFYVHQKFAMTTNVYRLVAANLDESGVQLGFFRKDFAASLLRSTYHVEGPGYVGTGQERSQVGALVRRFVDLPVPIHFDFVANDGSTLMTSDRQATLRDRYTVRVPDERVDFRVAAAIAVGVDALMQR